MIAYRVAQFFSGKGASFWTNGGFFAGVDGLIAKAGALVAKGAKEAESVNDLVDKAGALVTKGAKGATSAGLFEKAGTLFAKGAEGAPGNQKLLQIWHNVFINVRTVVEFPTRVLKIIYLLACL